jgi:DNA-binding PadR family transcriptional regulator
MAKSIEKVLEPVLNELRRDGLIELWERERELKRVRKNQRSLNRAIRESKERGGKRG